jgi:uridine kinase
MPKKPATESKTRTTAPARRRRPTRADASAPDGRGVQGGGVQGEGVQGEGVQGGGVQGEGVQGKGVQSKGVQSEGVVVPTRRVLIGIAGGTASGKTMVADQVGEMLGSDKVAVIKQDSYYRDLSDRPFEERVKENFDHPDAFDRKLLYNHVRLMLEGSPVNLPIYDFKRHIRKKKTHRVVGCHIIILEGILLLDDPLLRELMDIRVYIDTDPDIRLMRRIERDVTERGRTLESVLEQYEKSVRPMHLQFVEPSKRYADIIVPEGGHNEVAIDLLVTKIRSVLDSRGGGH